MLKKVLLLGLIISFTNLFAQHTLTGKMKPAKGKYTWVILYKLNGANQKYVNNATIKDGGFSLEIPKGTPAGMYRILYDNDNNKFLDFLYNDEDVTVEFHPDYPSQLVKFDKSEENKLFQAYVDKISNSQNKLDSLQVVYFKTKDKSEENKLSKQYTKELEVLKKSQSDFETKSDGKLAKSFIKANNRFFSNELIKDTNIYLKTIKQHYFDYVNFDSETLLKSSLLIDRVMDFVFYLNTSNDPKTLVKLRKEGVVNSLSKINKTDLKKNVIESLLYTFAQQENMEMVDYLLKEHFSKLPVAYQDLEFKALVKDMLKTTIGNKAPNLIWKEKGKEKSLYNLEIKDKKYYIIVFWSSTCTHCLKEMPRLQKYLEDKPEVQVIAIGLETEESRIGWTDEKYYYEDFIHILGENKYENKYVKDYGVNSTPNFFLLDANKTIIAKPYDVKELKEIYPKLSKSDSKKPEKK